MEYINDLTILYTRHFHYFLSLIELLMDSTILGGADLSVKLEGPRFALISRREAFRGHIERLTVTEWFIRFHFLPFNKSQKCFSIHVKFIL